MNDQEQNEQTNYFCRSPKAPSRQTGSHLCESFRIRSSNQSILAMRPIVLSPTQTGQPPPLSKKTHYNATYPVNQYLYRRFISQLRLTCIHFEMSASAAGKDQKQQYKLLLLGPNPPTSELMHL